MNTPVDRHTFWAVFSILLLSSLQLGEALVVPSELPSILSLIYSNIPQLKKGTDSRLGFGFRLGEHADFQVIVELGPQKETRPLGEKDESETFNKRQISKAQQMYLLRQQLQQQQQQQKQSNFVEPASSTERNASNWLENWSNDMNAGKKKAAPSKKQREKPVKMVAPPPAQMTPEMATVAEQSLKQLLALYQMASTTHAPSLEPQALQRTPPPFLGGPLNLGGPAGFTARPSDTQLQTLLDPRNTAKTKLEITKELMDVSLEEGQ